jgi:predicted TIM-barrel fold metal-dependent hydrolase
MHLFTGSSAKVQPDTSKENSHGDDIIGVVDITASYQKLQRQQTSKLRNFRRVDQYHDFTWSRELWSEGNSQISNLNLYISLSSFL